MRQIKLPYISAEQESEAFDLCIGADGIHSKVRQSVNADSKVLYQGYTCFRGLIDDIDLKHPIVQKNTGEEKEE